MAIMRNQIRSRARQVGVGPLAVAALLAISAVAFGADDSSPATSAAAPGGLLEGLLFYTIGGATALSALAVCFTQNIVRMAVWLMITLSSVALLYFLLAASFLGAIQLIIYAGGTLILLVFGVMLTSKSPWAKFTPSRFEYACATGVCVSLVYALCNLLTRTTWMQAEGIVQGATVAQIGRSLLTVYVVPFEAAGILLMIVMVGAAHLARQEKP